MIEVKSNEAGQSEGVTQATDVDNASVRDWPLEGQSQNGNIRIGRYSTRSGMLMSMYREIADYDPGNFTPDHC